MAIALPSGADSGGMLLAQLALGRGNGGGAVQLARPYALSNYGGMDYFPPTASPIQGTIINSTPIMPGQLGSGPVYTNPVYAGAANPTSFVSEADILANAARGGSGASLLADAAGATGAGASAAGIGGSFAAMLANIKSAGGIRAALASPEIGTGAMTLGRLALPLAGGIGAAQLAHNFLPGDKSNFVHRGVEGGLVGAGAGATAGMAIGALGGPIGMGAGAAIGAGVGALADLVFGGKKDKSKVYSMQEGAQRLSDRMSLANIDPDLQQRLLDQYGIITSANPGDKNLANQAYQQVSASLPTILQMQLSRNQSNNFYAQQAQQAMALQSAVGQYLTSPDVTRYLGPNYDKSTLVKMAAALPTYYNTQVAAARAKQNDATQAQIDQALNAALYGQ